jgi:phage shock protein A
MNTRVERAIEALRKPDHSLANVANTVRQALAEVIEDQQARIEALEATLRAVLEVTSESDVDVAWLTTLQQLAHATLHPEQAR